VYHLELRQFPHNLCRFNLDEHQLQAIVQPWSRDTWVELGERKWNPQQARLTILEGPPIPLEQLSMGRGWPAARRQSENVTERVLDAARRVAASSQDVERRPSADGALAADSLGLELLALLGGGPAPLAEAWRLAAARFPERSPSECLALAERAVSSLLRGRLLVLVHAGSEDLLHVAGSASDGARVAEAQLEPLLRARDSWLAPGQAGGVRMRKA
jgi:hypothetical protein